ncbi:hypothetical protein [Rhodohalobacter halophilus]|uniref:hypothetical protein n=1 Tax=Rhodohalobacter halophilus TaxID=1812810 RepID=UPI00083F8691|nr:hypothetical protein [Rhodohalobacter halophilus]
MSRTEQMIKEFWAYRANFLISFVLIGLVALPDAEFFHEWALAGIVGALLISVVRAIKAGKAADKKTAIINGLIIFLTSLICTAIFWYRAWLNLPSGILIEPVFDLVTGFGFWWPGILYASLFRHIDEGWSPSSRGRFLQNLAIGFGGSLLGLLIACILL